MLSESAGTVLVWLVWQQGESSGSLMSTRQRRDLHLEGSRRPLCSPHTAGQVVCPVKRNTNRTQLSALGANGVKTTNSKYKDNNPKRSH